MNVTLIGMPGCGKSTIGVLLAKELTLDFVDTDIVIQKNMNRSLQEILDENGYLYLRDIEEQEILKTPFDNSVIATGGSVVYSEKVMAYLASISHIFYLNVSYNEITKRVKNFEKRGIASAYGSTLYDVFLERVPLYTKYANTTIECDEKTVDEVLGEVISLSS